MAEFHRFFVLDECVSGTFANSACSIRAESTFTRWHKFSWRWKRNKFMYLTVFLESFYRNNLVRDQGTGLLILKYKQFLSYLHLVASIILYWIQTSIARASNLRAEKYWILLALVRNNKTWPFNHSNLPHGICRQHFMFHIHILLPTLESLNFKTVWGGSPAKANGARLPATAMLSCRRARLPTPRSRYHNVLFITTRMAHIIIFLALKFKIFRSG